MALAVKSSHLKEVFLMDCLETLNLYNRKILAGNYLISFLAGGFFLGVIDNLNVAAGLFCPSRCRKSVV